MLTAENTSDILECQPPVMKTAAGRRRLQAGMFFDLVWLLVQVTLMEIEVP